MVLCSLGIQAQSIQKSDGTNIDVTDGKIHVEPGNKRLVYFLKDSEKEQRVKFADLKEAKWGDFVFRTFTIEGKAKGYYVVAETASKTLVAIKRMRIKSRGGFESTYTHYEVAVLDKQNKIVDELSFTDENTDKKSVERSKVIPMIQKHFADCPKLIERASAFESANSDAKNTTILVFLNDPTFVQCQ